MTIRRDDSIVRCEVADDGRGGADISRGTGILGLRDRAEAAGGTLTLDQPAWPGHGRRAALPLARRRPGSCSPLRVQTAEAGVAAGELAEALERARSRVHERDAVGRAGDEDAAAVRLTRRTAPTRCGSCGGGCRRVARRRSRYAGGPGSRNGTPRRRWREIVRARSACPARATATGLGGDLDEAGRDRSATRHKATRRRREIQWRRCTKGAWPMTRRRLPRRRTTRSTSARIALADSRVGERAGRRHGGRDAPAEACPDLSRPACSGRANSSPF